MTTDTENGNSDQGNFAAGGAEAIRGQTGRTASDLHAAIMNLPCKPPLGTSERRRFEDEPEAVLRAYIEGHRDARHAAAELALAAAPSADKAELRDPHFGGHSYDASLLRELLAVIHRDGGHYVAEHGIEKACADAQAKWLAVPPTPLLREAMDRLEKIIAKPDYTNPEGMVRDLRAAIAKLRETLGTIKEDKHG